MSKARQGLVGMSRDEQGKSRMRVSCGLWVGLWGWVVRVRRYCGKKSLYPIHTTHYPTHYSLPIPTRNSSSLLFRANSFYSLPRRQAGVLIRERGFTLLELMVVVVIIGITIGGVLFVAAGSYRKTSVRNAARDVASLMRMASSKALSERVYYNLVLNRSTGDCYLEKHYSGVDGVWEDISASSGDETDDNIPFVTDNSPGAKKKLANVVDIDNINSDTTNVQRMAFTLKETVMGRTNDGGTTWTQSDTYSIYLDDDDSGTGDVQYRVTVDSDTARVKIYSSW